MVENTVERKLRAILSADVVDYSRMMGEDRVGTYHTLTARLESIRSIISEHKGRVFSSPGDAIMAEFPSVVDSVQCAINIQESIEAINDEVPGNQMMRFRIGVNIGDVIVNGEQIYGDGVNIAVRLEKLADAGGICLSERAYEEVENKLELPYIYWGIQKLKNIARPIKVYSVKLSPGPGNYHVSKKLMWEQIPTSN